MKPKKHKLNIFKVLEQISVKNRNYYSCLSDEEKKAIAPLVIQRWLSGTKDARQVYFLNSFANEFIFNLSNHKELLIDLLIVCSSGKNQRYLWNKAKGKKSSKLPNVVNVIQQIFGYSSSKAYGVVSLLSDDDILNYAHDLGLQTTEIKQIKKELKERNGL